jgi:hypothetical protein
VKLLTKEIEARFAKIGRQEGVADPVVVCKFFNPCGSGTWYMTEYDPAERVFFCYVTGLAEDEWGYTSLDELAAVRVPPFGLGIERDMHFRERPISEVAPGAVSHA